MEDHAVKFVTDKEMDDLARLAFRMPGKLSATLVATKALTKKNHGKTCLL